MRPRQLDVCTSSGGKYPTDLSVKGLQADGLTLRVSDDVLQEVDEVRTASTNMLV